MTSGVALFLGAVPDLTLSAMHKKFIGQAAAALNIFYRKYFTIGEFPFAMNISLVKIHQPLLEGVIIFTVCDINGADPAIKTARRNEIRIYCHIAILAFIIIFYCRRITRITPGTVRGRYMAVSLHVRIAGAIILLHYFTAGNM
jgi:hypothetical protein